MIINPVSLENKYKCGKVLGNYLANRVDPFYIKDGSYYFTIDEEFLKILKSLPLWFKLLKKI